MSVSVKYDTVIIGAGLSGLTAAALLAKRGLKVAVIDKNHHPGGSCGIFKRGDTIFDFGSSMLFGWGEKGFNPHRFVFNCLEEPIKLIKHEVLYCVNYNGKRIVFWPDLGRFTEELGQAFPSEKENIKRFYKDLSRIYRHVMVENPAYTTPDETRPIQAMKSFVKHPASYLRFLSLLNRSTADLLSEYFSDPSIMKFFDKLTSTYCYTTVKETPAILSAVMFVDNHTGGSYYPTGSTLFLSGKLEKVIEEGGGDMIMDREAVSILFTGGVPSRVILDDGRIIKGAEIIYSGTVWNLFGRLIPPEIPVKKRAERMAAEATYPSVVLYALVDSGAIPEDALPVEMLVGNPDRIDESEVTVYIPGLDDKSICAPGTQAVMAIGPSFNNWDPKNRAEYKEKKEREVQRLISVLERRFPGISKSLLFAETATPATIERYTMKNNGSVAGPKQKIGQHMFKRLHTRSEWPTLFYCGESTVMGTGTPAVTVSGLSAANAVLKKRGLGIYTYNPKMKNYVTITKRPFLPEELYKEETPENREIMLEARRCQFCEHPACARIADLDVPGINRRTAVGNFKGAAFLAANKAIDAQDIERRCIFQKTNGRPVGINRILSFLESGGFTGEGAEQNGL